MNNSDHRRTLGANRRRQNNCMFTMEAIAMDDCEIIYTADDPPMYPRVIRQAINRRKARRRKRLQ